MTDKEITNKTADNQIVANSYEPPSIEVVEVSIEKGFANSAKDWDDGSW